MAILEIPKLTPMDIIRFSKSISSTKTLTECWVWSKFINPKGYGKFGISINGERHLYGAHRVSYTLFVKNIDKDMVIDHKCRNRACVNPSHLREATWEQNATENSDSMSAINKLKTHCRNGHEFNMENTVLFSDGRRCKVCNRERGLRRYHAKKNK